MYEITKEEKNPNQRCWFCRTNKSVKYVASMVNTNPLSERRFMKILVCEKCANNHRLDFVKDDYLE